MHKKSYASGFLYHSPTQQILLQHYTDSQHKDTSWSFFGGEVTSGESVIAAFQKIIKDSLKITLPDDTVFEIYDYDNSDGDHHTIIYAEIPKVQELVAKDTVEFTWVTTKQVDKLPLSKQMKQDITVGKRVIDARQRSLNPEDPQFATREQ